MHIFEIKANGYLSNNTTGFYHARYTGMGNIGNPDYLNDLKNTFGDFSESKLLTATQKLQSTLNKDLPVILQSLDLDDIVVCVVPRAKAEKNYNASQQLFRTTVQATIRQISGCVDGTNYLRRHTNTKTTHLRKPIRNHNNDGPEPYPGITEYTCDISQNIKGKNVLLIDDIYTPSVNIDEDAINALLKVGAKTVSFYAVGKV